jgi:methyl-accepting chemotaxis protein
MGELFSARSGRSRLGNGAIPRQTGASGMTAVLERTAAPCALRDSENALRAVVAESECEVEQLAHDFEGLARETSTILEIAGVIAGCAGDERMGSVLTGVQRLASAAKSFLRERVEATTGILETVTAEAALLERLAHLTRGQKAIVRETEMLRVLTNIEVARLGEVGAGFQYLAHELDDFAQAVARSTNEVTRHTDERRKAIEETRRSLTAELPRMREEFARVEQSLEAALASVEAALEQLRGTPVRFSGCVEEIARQIAGVVAGIQAHDITRQQIEHVQAALLTIADELGGEERPSAGTEAGLMVQSYQLRSVRETVRGWTTQIGSCLEAIRHITSSEILELGPVVLAQHSALGAHLTRIEELEEECEADNARVQASFAGISGLMQLVNEHLERSKVVRDRLQLLMFNSIVEASHLGSQADGILEISTTIKRISATWREITTGTEAATEEIRTLVEQSRTTVEAFSEASKEGLRAARGETMGGLGVLRDAAECADRRGREIQRATLGLQAKIAEAGSAGHHLEVCFEGLDAALEGIETARRQLEKEREPGDAAFDREEVERRFSAGYTTEMERAVLRAALEGGPMPVAQRNFAGNSVELF